MMAYHIQHTKSGLLYSCWDSEFIWVISNSKIKYSSIYHGSSGINDGIMPTRSSGNAVWVGVDWFCSGDG